MLCIRLCLRDEKCDVVRNMLLPFFFFFFRNKPVTLLL